LARILGQANDGGVAQIADQAVPNHSAIEILDQTQDLS